MTKILRIINHVAHPSSPQKSASKIELTVQRPSEPEPTAFELAVNFSGAMARVTAAAFSGKQVWVSEEDYRKRASICDNCELWDGTARFGLGKCKAPGCGCSKFKSWLFTEKCKHPSGSKWPEIIST
jgi:hypothetical protein